MTNLYPKLSLRKNNDLTDIRENIEEESKSN